MIDKLYDMVAAPLMLSGYRLWSIKDEKAKRFFRDREGMFERLTKELDRHGADERETILFHAASVGELLQAIPVMAETGRRRPDSLIVLSYTSPSVTDHMPGNVPAHIVTPSPLDTSALAGRFMDMIRPDLIVFSTYDLWPNMLFQAADRGVPVIMINAHLPASAGRLRFPARLFHSRVYGELHGVGAINKEDGARFSWLGVSEDLVRVTGNCRYDQTLSRCESVEDDDPDLAPMPIEGTVIIGGSVWSEDLKRLLPALSGLMEEHEEVKVVLAPHEPTDSHVAEVEDYFAGLPMETERYTDLVEKERVADARVMVVDTVGVLYKLYKKADLAYVGGGFRQGVHSVMEPAGMGLPVIFGPMHDNSAEAIDMEAEGAATSVTETGELRTALERLIHDREKLKDMGERAKGLMERNSGATRITTDMVEEFLAGKKP